MADRISDPVLDRTGYNTVDRMASGVSDERIDWVTDAKFFDAFFESGIEAGIGCIGTDRNGVLS